MGDAIKAIILGIVEGLTEFLPVSSTGHLIIVNKYIYFQKDFQNLFDVVIQAGAIIAVIIYFWKRIFPDFKDKKQTRRVLRLWWRVLAGFLPAMVFGLLFDKTMEKYLFYPLPVAIALIVGAILLLYAEARLKNVRVVSTNKISYKDAFSIGLFQCLALWPGMSRSSSTIIGGLFMGLSREVSAEFSFFLAIPTILGASAYKLYKAIFKSAITITSSQWMILLLGTAVSFIVALMVVSLFMNYIKKKKLAPFAYYRIAIGILVILLLV